VEERQDLVLQFPSGTRLGVYEITGVIGVGGMGEVYRARDTRLERSVAIKVLPELFAADPSRVARFEREAKTLAALNHPNIAQIHGLEEGRALVMELVDGEDLAERLRREPIPLDDAVAIARQVAEALEAAHELGIVHRDLKPANIKLRPDGVVKVLDFGLAKALDPPENRSGRGGPSMDSPTFTSPARTQTGVILGTAAYMAPEQARGKAVDRRADIWAFGCVLYEMLTRQRPFGGGDTSMTIAAILKDSVDYRRLPAETPASIRRLLRRCLEKDARKRLSAIADARLELDERDDVSSEASAPAGARRWGTRVIWALAGAALAIAVFVSAPARGGRNQAQPLIRSEISFPATPLVLSADRVLALSPDGGTLVFAGSAPSGEAQLYRRRLAEETVTPIQGTQGATAPFFSPDGQWIGFKQDSRLKKIPASGGIAIDYGDATRHQGGSFAPDGTLIFNAHHGEGLRRVRPGTTTQEALTTVNAAAAEAGHHWPHVLPDAKHALYTLEVDGKPYSEARIMLLSLADGQSRLLIDGGSDARYVPTGHIVYWRAGDIWSVPFDLRSRQLTGEPAVVIRNVMLAEANGHAHLAIADNGTVAYVAGADAEGQRIVVVTDRKGVIRPLTAERRAYQNPRVSPDGSRVALTVIAANDSLWTLDIARGAMTRITFESENSRPVWSPDGTRLLFARHSAEGVRRIFSVAADGGGSPEQLRASDRTEVADSWSAAANVIMFTMEEAHGPDVWTLPMSGERKARPWLATRFAERQAQISPDGRWVAYVSNESGRDEVYVRSYSALAHKRQVSVGGGSEPRWRRDGRELLFRHEQSVLSTQVADVGDALRFSLPVVLFKSDFLMLSGPRSWGDWDVLPDGQRFVFIQDFARPRATVMLIQNWFTELKSKSSR
jgi:serine/threonine-protein kinase